jgi:hypothetical protein
VTGTARIPATAMFRLEPVQEAVASALEQSDDDEP